MLILLLKFDSGKLHTVLTGGANLPNSFYLI